MVTEQLIRDRAAEARDRRMRAETALWDQVEEGRMDGAALAHLAVCQTLAELWGDVEAGLDRECRHPVEALAFVREEALKRAVRKAAQRPTFGAAVYRAQVAGARRFYDSTAPLTAPPPMEWDETANLALESGR